MRKYRLVLLLKRDLKKDERTKLLDTVKLWMGKISNDSLTEIGERKLAYTIKHEKSGDYVILDFESEKVAEGAEKRIEIQENVLRHLLVRMD